ncbi:MAG: adenylate/guanylate cyclase domain-containing protein [Treponema sp.]|nr:adenylate/guanylate cyclase domain-containing protein [Treponema sp.]
MKKFMYLIYPAIAIVLCSLLHFTSLDNKLADLFQRALPSTKESSAVTMVNVNDYSIESIGTWPFSRDVYADSLNQLKEIGVDTSIFDLSFLDPSQAKVDVNYVLEDLPRYISDEFSKLDDSVLEVLSGYADGTYSADDAQDALDYIQEAANNAENQINVNVSYVIRSIDSILAESIKFFDNTYLTLTFDNSAPELSEEEDEYLANMIALDNIEVVGDTLTPEYDKVNPALHMLMQKAKSAGFVNADPDDDGYMRRVSLFIKYKGKYYGQLVLVPILRYLGNPKIIISNKNVILKNCRFPDYSIKDIKIPRDENGYMILKYPKFTNYNDYNHISLWNIYRLALLEKSVYKQVSILNNNGFFTYWDKDNPQELFDTAEFIHAELLNGEDPENDITYDNYFYYKNAFISSLYEYLHGDARQVLIDNEAYGDQSTIDFINEEFDNARENFMEYYNSRNIVADQLRYGICIFGTNATSTTDFGLNQYQERFPNPGVHYAVANQLLSGDFVDDSPWYYGLLIAIVICYAYAFATHSVKSTGRQILIGVASIIAATVLLLLFFVITRIYVESVIPLASLTVTFIIISVAGYLVASHEKRFIQGAFSQCLSPDVVKEIVDNPSSFKLGGQTIDMTAIFTDIQKFSGFSELLTAGQLVALLNFYLTKMSDIIMDQRGTVDKYEGDAIVAFVGAPVKTAEHAALACRAAINMKKAEVEMNEYIRQVAAAPKPEDMDDETYEAFCIMVKNNRTIFTRIGLNSGEIVAGYMGSTNKKNYTMMGNNVNLASRLEGVNKQYRTGGILMSAATRKNLGEEFVVRSLDRVQVVNVVTPIRLYELIGIKDQLDEKTLKYMAAWEQTMKEFESGDYEKSLEHFKKLSAAKPDDNVAKYYIELIEKFFINGKYPTENDDFGVAYNPENPADMNEMWFGTPYEIKGTFKLLQK